MIKSIAYDFDGTLATTAYPVVGKQYWIHKLICYRLKKLHDRGVFIIINSLRDEKNNKDNGDAHRTMLKWLTDNRIPFDLVNDNQPEATAKWGYARKVNADRYVDDRNIGLIGIILRYYNNRANK